MFQYSKLYVNIQANLTSKLTFNTFKVPKILVTNFNSSKYHNGGRERAVELVGEILPKFYLWATIPETYERHLETHFASIYISIYTKQPVSLYDFHPAPTGVRQTSPTILVLQETREKINLWLVCLSKALAGKYLPSKLNFLWIITTLLKFLSYFC